MAAKTCNGCKALKWTGSSNVYNCSAGFKRDNELNIPLEKCPKPKSEPALYDAEKVYWNKRREQEQNRDQNG